MPEAERGAGELIRNLRGVIHVQLTPFSEDGGLDEAALRENTRWVIEHGLVKGRGVLLVGGSLGEGFSLSDAEYRRLIDIATEEAAGKVPVCVGCIRPATRPVIELARYCEQAGADCIMVLAPHYFPNEPEEVIYAHFRAVAEATPLPIVVYNNLFPPDRIFRSR